MIRVLQADRSPWWYAGIMLLGACLIFFRLTRADLLSDDAHYSVTALTYIDYVSSTAQTTPLQWFDRPPWWMWLSFHGAPPFVFLIQHGVFYVWGDSVFTARLPFALAGIATLALLMYVARMLYGARVAAWAGLMLVLNPYFIWSSRIGLLEGIALAWIMASLACFVRARTRPSLLLWWGVTLGLSFISKYTAFFLLPVFGALVVWWRRTFAAQPGFRTRLLAACGMALLIFMPVVIYNAEMWRARGHFDLQFSRLFGQDLSDWSNLARGTDVSALDNFFSIVGTLQDAMPLLLLVPALAGIMLALKEQLRREADHTLLLFACGCVTGMFMMVSPTVRYLPLYTPFLALGTGLWCERFISWVRRIPRARGLAVASVSALFGVAAAYLLIVGWNTNHAYDVRGMSPAWYLPIRTAQLGYNQLDAYVGGLIRHVRPPIPAVSQEFQKVPRFLRALDRRLNDRSLPVFSDLILYDENMNWFGRFWALQRWMYTTFVPVFSLNNALLQYQRMGEEYIRAGITAAYVILPVGENIIPAADREYYDSGGIMRAYFARERIAPRAIIRDPSGQERFYIYYVPRIWDVVTSLFPL